ncbi:MAG: alpha-galactosidase [Fidelibacterota bacterium]|nr:MAG: alpha-galactosidase [Candidatus Neomarinimicrobiota bacterium]
MNNISRYIVQLMIILIVLALTDGCTPEKQAAFVVDGKEIRIEFTDQLHSRVVSALGNEEVALGVFSPSEFLRIHGGVVTDFAMDTTLIRAIEDKVGTGKEFHISGKSSAIKKDVIITHYDDFPAMLTLQVVYTNMGDEDLLVEGWTNHGYSMSSSKPSGNRVSFWSYQSASYEDRRDWVLPLEEGFSQQNYLGMNASDYGGGTPVVDIWRPDVGLGVGHLELIPKLVSLPVAMPGSREATVAVSYDKAVTLPPGESLPTFRTFVMVHQGDYFHTLSEYRRFMIKQGITFRKPPSTAFEPIWCAWGYRRDFTMEQIYGTFPMVKQLGFDWAVLDDGWQTAEGDWYLHPDKFPNGDVDMQNFVKEINDAGFKAKLWWAPLAVDPGTDLISKHPEYLLLNEDGSYQDISWWNSYYLCPAYQPVQAYTRDLVETIMKTWGYAGLKIDGQHLNGAPPCYNPAHNHAYPEESVEKVPEFFKVIYDSALELNAEAVVEICPCGTAFSFFTLPYMNQSVSSDPLNSWQIRLKGKTLKALTGNDVAYYGDHVELSDQGSDFASSVGVGAVIGTKFTWPVGAGPAPDVDDKSGPALTPERVEKWAKWIRIYREKMLSTGTYQGELYDIGFDRPETHAIRKGVGMYYAFYADHYSGNVQLRGLDEGMYTVYDYENERDLGSVTGPVGELEVDFKAHLLLEVLPQ